MFKKVGQIFLVILLAVFCFHIPLGVGTSSAATFNDTATHWSSQVVEKASALDIMKGYPGDIFKPKEPMSRLEAIAIIIRAMGLEEQANTINWRSSGIKLPGGMFWGQGHLVIAAQQNLIHKDYVSQLLYAEPITRAEVSTLVSLALRDKLKVKGDPQKLTFADSDKISPDYKQYVADVTQNGIMQGISETEFAPNKYMERGEMAALMVKTVQDNWFTYRSDNLIAGTINSIDSVTDIITISKNDGTQIFRPTNSRTVFYIDSKEGSLSGFRVGDNVLAITNSGGYITYMENSSNTSPISPPGTEQVLTGKIIDRELTGTNTIRIQDSSYQTHTYPLATAVVITSSTGTRDLSLLTNNQYITVKVLNNAIQSINVLDSQTWEGSVTTIFNNQFVLRTSSDEYKIFTVDESKIKILNGNNKLSFSNLKIGDMIKVVAVSGAAQEIIVQSFNDDNAEIRSIDTFYYMITLRFADGTRKEFEVETNATIRKDSENIRLYDLEPNDKITFRLGNTGKINQIIVSNKNGDISGEVTGLTLGSNPRIYIDSDRYTLDKDIKVTRNGRTIDLEDIMIGAEVELDLNSRDYVTAINVINDTDINIEGIVTNVDISRNRITIEQSNRQRFTIRVDSRCVLRDSTSYGPRVTELEDLEEDWEVRISLDDGIAQTIRVLEK